jgi:endonuclease/exonuclease/phosphatase family metal-dependent hydrolase
MRLWSVFALGVLCACEPLSTSWDEVTVAERRQAKDLVEHAAPALPQLKVMNWNVKFGAARIDFFFDLWGDRTVMNQAEVLANLDGLYRLIREVGPDLLLVQEIETNSRRSAHIDMVQGILDNTDLNYAAYFPVWRSRFVPKEGLGRVDMGNAILSRYPIVEATRIAQADRQDLPAHERYFYLHRGVGRAVIEVGQTRLAAHVVHAEAYETGGTNLTNARHLEQILELAEAEALPFVLGGDFNALPPGSVKLDGFNDEHPSAAGTDFAQPPYDLQYMAPFYDRYQPVISLERYGTTEAEQRRYYTHSVIGPHQVGANGEPGFWTRTLDYLFVEAPSRWVDGTTHVLQQQGDLGITSDPLVLSDHCPVVGTWEFPR